MSQQVIQEFVKQLNQKIQQNKASKLSDEKYLITIFKFFDQDQDQLLHKREFIQAITKTGYCFVSNEIEDIVFNHYSQNSSQVNYKTFCQIFLTESGGNQTEHFALKKPFSQQQNVPSSIEELQNLIQVRYNIKNKKTINNLNSYLELLGEFQQYDYEQNGFVEVADFQQALKNKYYNYDENIINQVSDFLQNNGVINYQEFFQQLLVFLFQNQEPLSQQRSKMIKDVFMKIEKNQEQVSLSTLTHNYDPSKDIQVQKGVITSEQSFKVFVENMKIYFSAYKIQDNSLNQEQFLQFFSFLSNVQDKDELFRDYIYGVWESVLVQEIPHFPDEAILRDRNKLLSLMEYQQKFKNDQFWCQMKQNNQLIWTIQRLRQNLQNRGWRGLLGFNLELIGKQNQQHTYLNLQQFTDVLYQVLRIGNLQDDVRVMFSDFDYDRKGLINVEEFVEFLQENQPEFRFDYYERLFRKIDSNNDGIVDFKELKQNYFFKYHPECQKGKRTVEYFQQELQDTFQLFKQLRNIPQRETQLSKYEFIDYIRYFGSSIQDDDLFRQTFLNIFQLTQENSMQNCRAGNFLNNVEIDNSRQAYMANNHPQFLVSTDKNQHLPFGTDKSQQQFQRPQLLQINKLINFRNTSQSQKSNDQLTQDIIFAKLRNAIIIKGAKFALYFFNKIYDNGLANGQMNFYNFQKITKYLNLQLLYADEMMLFNHFQPQNGNISFEQLWTMLFNHQINQNRENMIQQALQFSQKQHYVRIDELQQKFYSQSELDLFIKNIEIYFKLKGFNQEQGKIEYQYLNQFLIFLSHFYNQDYEFEGQIFNSWAAFFQNSQSPTKNNIW